MPADGSLSTDRWCKTSRNAVVLQAERSAGGLHKSLMFTGPLPVHRFRRLQLTLKKEKKKEVRGNIMPENFGNITPNFRHQKPPYGEMVSNVSLIKFGRLLPAKNMKFDTRCWGFSVYLITFFHSDLLTNLF